MGTRKEWYWGILITEATGAGKIWLSCALNRKACMHGYTVLYKRMSPLLIDWRIGFDFGNITPAKILETMTGVSKMEMPVQLQGIEGIIQ